MKVGERYVMKGHDNRSWMVEVVAEITPANGASAVPVFVLGQRVKRKAGAVSDAEYGTIVGVSRTQPAIYDVAWTRPVPDSLAHAGEVLLGMSGDDLILAT